MQLIIYKPERVVVVDGVRRVISKHEQWYCADSTKDFHCGAGIIRKEQLVPGQVKVGNNEFILIPASFLDNYKTIKREAQIITRKDIGFLVGYCGLGKNSVVLESGAGSGSATILLANICKQVYSIELEQKNIDVVQENLAKLGVKNAKVTNGNMYDTKSVTKALGKKQVDVVLLDVPEPWQALASAIKAVKLGGHIIAYTPSITQAAQFVNTLSVGVLHERTVEIIDRDWRIKGDAVRPVTADIGHTAFLTIVRRIL